MALSVGAGRPSYVTTPQPLSPPSGCRLTSPHPSLGQHGAPADPADADRHHQARDDTQRCAPPRRQTLQTPTGTIRRVTTPGAAPHPAGRPCRRRHLTTGTIRRVTTPSAALRAAPAPDRAPSHIGAARTQIAPLGWPVWSPSALPRRGQCTSFIGQRLLQVPFSLLLAVTEADLRLAKRVGPGRRWSLPVDRNKTGISYVMQTDMFNKRMIRRV